MSLPAISEKTHGPRRRIHPKAVEYLLRDELLGQGYTQVRSDCNPPASASSVRSFAPIRLELADTDANPARCPLPPGGVMERPILQTPGWATPSSLRSCLLLTALESKRLSSFESRRTR